MTTMSLYFIDFYLWLGGNSQFVTLVDLPWLFTRTHPLLVTFPKCVIIIMRGFRIMFGQLSQFSVLITASQSIFDSGWLK